MDHDLIQLDLFQTEIILTGTSGHKDVPVVDLDIPVSRQATATGRIEKIISFNELNGECLLDARIGASKKAVIVSSRVPRVWPGLSFTATCFENDGPQVGAVGIELDQPQTSRHLKKFLKSKALGPLGKKTIEALAREFPTDFFTVLTLSPERLRRVPGIGKGRAQLLLNRWREYQISSQLDQFLFDENLPLLWARDLRAAGGEAPIESFVRNPYAAVNLYGFSFETVDAFALRQGFQIDHAERLKAGLRQMIENRFRQGHCAYPDEQLLREASLFLKVDREKVENTLELAILQEEVVTETIDGTSCIYAKSCWDLERDVASRLLKISKSRVASVSLQPSKMVQWAQRILEIKLSDQQVAAVEETLSSPLTVITGGPGTGKTTLVQCLVAILESQSVRYALCAPTGRAAQRLSATTGSNASTVHRLLQLNGSSWNLKKSENRQDSLNIEMLLVDEASMLDLSLMSHLLKALPSSCAVVLIGDANQLPSVGAGAVLQSLISSGKFPVVELKDVFRQASGGGIQFNADRIRRGLMPRNIESQRIDFRYIPTTQKTDVIGCIKELLGKTLPEECGVHDLNQVQILTPMNLGAFVSRHLNEELRDLFTDGLKTESSVFVNTIQFRRGDKVMVTQNDYVKNVFNGDVGFVLSIKESGEMIEVSFAGRIVTFKFDELHLLTLAYAISIHKSQGSEYPAVIIVLTKDHLSLAQRHLIYTAVTRGKHYVFLVADPEVLQAAVTRSEKRWQNLTTLLREARP